VKRRRAQDRSGHAPPPGRSPDAAAAPHRSTSNDFRHWTAPEGIDFGDSEIEHLYTNMTTPYERAPGMYFMFAKRFVPWRRADASWRYDGLSETVLLSSRDGTRFDRTFMEPFVRPGLDPLNWNDRSIMMA
jgi:hypothetical protein